VAEKTYRIGQAARKLGLKPHVLRFWESEFPQIEPVRTPSGQRLYTESHLGLLTRVRDLVREEGLTLEGARRRLEQEEAAAGARREVARDIEEMRGAASWEAMDLPGGGPG